MATKTNRSTTPRDQRRHDQRAMLQWLAIGLFMVLAIIAAFVLVGGDDGGGHGGQSAPAVSAGV